MQSVVSGSEQECEPWCKESEGCDATSIQSLMCFDSEDKAYIYYKAESGVAFRDSL